MTEQPGGAPLAVNHALLSDRYGHDRAFKALLSRPLEVRDPVRESVAEDLVGGRGWVRRLELADHRPSPIAVLDPEYLHVCRLKAQVGCMLTYRRIYQAVLLGEPSWASLPTLGLAGPPCPAEPRSA